VDADNNSEVEKVETDRRVDQGTRAAIETIERSLFDPDASDNIFSELLKCLAEITQSTLGVCFVSGEHAEFPILPTAALSSISYKQTNSFINTQVLSSWVGQKNVLTSAVFYNDPIPKGTQALLTDPSAVSSIMILPIILNYELRAICILASEDKYYNTSVLVKIKPIIDAAICILQSAETVRGNFSGLDQKIADSRFLSSLISSSPIGVIVVDEHSRIILSNPSAQDIFDPESVDIELHETKSLSGTNIHEFFPCYEAFFQWSNQHDKLNVKSDTHGPRLWEEQQAYRKDGSACYVNLTLFRYSQEGKRYTTIQVQDITNFHVKTEEYKRISQQLNALTQLAPVGIIHVTIEWHCIFANEKWTEFSGLTQEESADRSWINAIHPNDASDLLMALRNSLELGNDHNQEVRLVSPMGSTKWVDFSMRVLFDVDGNVEGFLGTCHDITERYVNQENLRHIAEYDGLTGLATRMLFQDRLQQAFYDSERDDSIVSVFFLDLDGFKDVNDTLGHDIGDILLQKVSDRLVNTLRKNDTIARFGGDEFVVMLGRDDHLSEVITVANKVIEGIAKPYYIEDQEIFITTSLGIAQGTMESASPEILLKNADFALYAAKNEGKNKFQLFNEALEANSKSRINLVSDLRSGLQKKRFLLHYQAICDVQTDTVVGFEALLRFIDKNNKLIAPDIFIPLLEESGMIVAVGNWVIEEVCRQLADWKSDKVFPTDAYITFNVSAKQLINDSLALHIQKSCDQYEVDPHRLVMEITESVIINKPANVRVILDKIKSSGVRLALDDFGTGYSSLSYLQNFPFNIIKIDKSFVDDLTEHSNDTKIVKAIIALATSLELLVVAEGVETELSLQMVKQLGANLSQGYLISRPLAANHILSFIRLRKEPAVILPAIQL
jgi:diguanylate cyclase (GGDEF)-like protein/PAS domain S-box-containing protein